MMKLLAIALLCAGGATTLHGVPAVAESNREPIVTERVSTSNLNLNLARDQARLKARISYAAYRLCLVDSPATPSPAIADPKCHRAAMASAIEQMDRLVAHAVTEPTLASGEAGRR